MIKLFSILLVFIFIFPVLSGCKKEQPVKRAPKKAAGAAAKQGPVPSQADQKTSALLDLKSFAYEPGDRRDPFAPLVEDTRRKQVEKKVIIKGTLESYDLPEFKLVAIAGRGFGDYYALLVTPDNKSFTVRQGTILGLNSGKITQITENKVEIIEYIKDYKGELKPKKVVLELRKEGVE